MIASTYQKNQYTSIDLAAKIFTTDYLFTINKNYIISSGSSN
jgi:hypothetical protein